jgi:hypothetical protein
MSTKPRAEKSAFLIAAEAFDDELGSFQRAVEATLRGPLYTAKHLDRATLSLNQAAQCEQRLGLASKVLSDAISDAHQQQQAQTQKVMERAQAISMRGAQLGQLMEGYKALGVAAATLSSEAAEILRKKKELGEKEQGGELLTEVQTLKEKLSAVAQIAQQLVETARAEDFEDIARQADSVRQQLLSGHNRLSLLNQSTAG